MNDASLPRAALAIAARRSRPTTATAATALAAGIALVVAACGRSTDELETGPATPAADPAATVAPARVDVPAELDPSPWLAVRRATEVAASATGAVFDDFTLRDGQPESGITFVGRITDDSGRTFKPNHYDHGSAVAAADVDGDGLPDLYFAAQLGPNALWRNRGDGTFEDITAAAGVGVPGRVCVGASFADVDNDGDPDLYVTCIRDGNALFENDGSGRFRDVTAASGLGHRGHSSGAVFFDYDRDGRLDLFLTNVGAYTSDEVRTSTNPLRGGPLDEAERRFYDGYKDAFFGQLKPERTERSLLFHNEGDGAFRDVSDAVGLVAEGWNGEAAVIDGNDDGWPDLYVANMQGPNDYFENDQGRAFTNRRAEVFARTPTGAMGLEVFDADNDGRFDLYVTDMHSDMTQVVDPLSETLKSSLLWPEAVQAPNDEGIFGNAFFKRGADGGYEELSDAYGLETFWPWGPSAGDLNADGFDDLFVTAGMGYDFRYGVNSLLLNDGGRRFVDRTFTLGAEPRRDGRFAIPYFELDCDDADRRHVDCKDRSGRITVWAAVSSRSSAMLDLEGDGDLDIVTSEIYDVPIVLVSDLAQRWPERRSLRLRLVGSASNRDGLGARIAVTAGGRTMHAVHDGKSGYLAQSALPLVVGLDGAAAVDRVEVVWPSGARQVVDGPIDPATALTIEEPDAAAQAP